MAGETVTVCPHPDRRATARGLCSSCYYMWRRDRPPTFGGRGLNPYGGPASVLDVLVTDGGWLTPDGIGLVLPSMSERHVKRTLQRLRDQGFVESRQVALRGWVGLWSGKESTAVRYEWRAVSDVAA
jgi:hypothetical protein